jgi:hypothetical protein
MDGAIQTTALRLGVLLLALGLGGYAIAGLIRGTTTGYYRSHVYSRAGQPAGYYRWISLRLVLAILGLWAWSLTGS